VEIRAAREADRPAIEAILDDWGMRWIARLDELHDVLADDAVVAIGGDGALVGLATWRVDGDEAELTTLSATTRHAGIGTALVEAVVDAVGTHGVRRLWLVTTNDNVDALRFYQRRGFRLVEVRAGAVDRSRATIKPTIHEFGEYRIPIRDELILERDLSVRPTRVPNPSESGDAGGTDR
jgi:N-acetylglutamate synthase-like GNAT family acetyltransferase